MELPGRRELREQILHQMDGRTSYVSDADVYIERKEEQEGTAAISERVSGSAAVTADFSSGRIFS